MPLPVLLPRMTILLAGLAATAALDDGCAVVGSDEPCSQDQVEASEAALPGGAAVALLQLQGVAAAGQPGGAEAAAATSDPCSCLPWSSVYSSMDVNCHASPGFEYENDLTYYKTAYPNITREKAFEAIDGLDWNNGTPSPGKEGLCENFLMKFTDSFCVNQHFENISAKSQWCYVSSSCQELNGGHFVNERVSARVCDGQPAPLTSASELEALAARYDLQYAPGYSVRSAPFMFVAKLTMSAYNFSQFFNANCDPVADAPTCTRVVMPPLDSCECLPWRTVYEFGNVSCHKSPGFEYYDAYASYYKLEYPNIKLQTAYDAYDGLDWNNGYPQPNKEGICENFLMRISDGFCIQQYYENASAHGQSWCYVQSSCKELNGGHTVSPTVSARFCDTSDSYFATTASDFQNLNQKYRISYGPGYDVGTATWLFLAKLVLNGTDYTRLFDAYCDPVQDSPYCTARFQPGYNASAPANASSQAA